MAVHFMTYISVSNVTALLFAAATVTFTVSVATPTAAATNVTVVAIFSLLL